MREHPGPLLPGRFVSHVNRVPALEVSDPVALLVHVEADDSPRWRIDCRHRATAAYTLGVHRSRYVDGLRAGAKP